MKKILALLVCLLTISNTGVRADDDRQFVSTSCPLRHRYVKKYFPQEKVALAKMEKDFFDKKYEVIFANSSKVEFFKDGTWKEVDCKYSTVPEAVIPGKPSTLCKATYPDHKVVKIEKED